MVFRTQIVLSLSLLVLVFLALLPILPYPMVIQVTTMLEFSPLEDLFVPPYQHPLDQAIRRQRQEVQELQLNCEKVVSYKMLLPDLSVYDDILLTADYHNLMFFLETSNRHSLTIRQACAVESATRYSGRNVVLGLSSDMLDICNKKMLPVLAMPNLLLVRLNTSLLVNNTPLQKVWDDGRIARSCCSIIHISDLLRMAVVYR